MANRFNKFMDKWMLHRIWGIPLRMVFVCDWHRRHAILLAIAAGVGWVGYTFSQKWLLATALVVAAPSALCFFLLPVLAITFLGIERLFEPRNDK